MKLRATGVIVRFIPLLDVAFILVGLLMILVAHAQARSKQPAAESKNLAQIAGLDFIYLYAGTAGTEQGRCYELNADKRIVREIRSDVNDDLERLKAQRGSRKNPIVLLLISDKGFDSMWSDKKLQSMERTWNLKVVPVYGIQWEPRT